MPVNIWIILVEHPSHFGETLAMIGVICLAFGVPAITIGWILHCIAVMIRDARRRRTRSAG